MSIATEITRISDAKEAIRESIIDKGVHVPSGETIDEYASYIDLINPGLPDNALFYTSEDNEVIAPDVTYLSGNTITANTNTNGLGIMVFSNPITSIWKNAFYNKKIKSIITPETVTSIGDNAFDMAYIESIVLSKNLTSIGKAAFANSFISRIVIPDGVSSIPEECFVASFVLNQVTIGSGCTDIYYDAFSSEDNLEYLVLKPTTPPTISGGTLLIPDKTLIFVPSGCEETYKSAEGWSTFADQIHEEF